METATIQSRLETFRFGSAEMQATFCRRLAQENGWSLSYTQRVLAEYKKFLILAALGQPVSPSYAVDQAWHLHLLFTDSYWNDLCPNYLRRPLHHFPSTSSDETEKLHQWYMQTLESYHRVFEAKPPGDIWPEAEQIQPMHIQQVDLNKNWVIPKSIRLDFLKLQTIILALATLAWISLRYQSTRQ